MDIQEKRATRRYLRTQPKQRGQTKEQVSSVWRKEKNLTPKKHDAEAEEGELNRKGTASNSWHYRFWTETCASNFILQKKKKVKTTGSRLQKPQPAENHEEKEDRKFKLRPRVLHYAWLLLPSFFWSCAQEMSWSSRLLHEIMLADCCSITALFTGKNHASSGALQSIGFPF